MWLAIKDDAGTVAHDLMVFLAAAEAVWAASCTNVNGYHGVPMPRLAGYAIVL